MEENVSSATADGKKSTPTWLMDLAKFIQSYGGPVPVTEVLDQVPQETEHKYEKKAIRILLRRHFKEIRWGHIDNPTCEWDDSRIANETPIPEVTTADLLVAWGKSSDHEREGLKQQFEAQLTSSKVSESDAQLARVIGIDSNEPDWNLVEIQRCTELNLIRQACETAPAWWCLDAAVTVKGTQREPAKVRIDSLEPAERSIEAVNSLERWLKRENSSVIPDMLRGLKTLIKTAPDPPLVSVACRYASALCSKDESDQLISALVGLIATADIGTIGSVFEEILETDKLRELLIRLAKMKRPYKDRRAMVLAGAGSTRAEALFDSEVFANLTLNDIGALISSEPLEELFNHGLKEHLYKPVKAAISVKLGENLASAANYPILESLLPTEILERQIQNDEPSARLARLAANGLIEKAVIEERGRGNLRIADLTDQLSQAEEDIAGQKASHAESVRTAALLEDRLRNATNSTAQTTDREIAQARIDVVTSMVDQAIKLEDLLSTMEVIGPLATICSALERDLEKFGVEKVGRRSEVAEFDPSLHEYLDIPKGTPVKVVRPAYRLTVDGTVIRLGLTTKGQPS